MSDMNVTLAELAKDGGELVSVLQEAMKVKGLMDRGPSMKGDSLFGFKKVNGQFVILTASRVVIDGQGTLMGWPDHAPSNMAGLTPFDIMRGVDYKAAAMQYEGENPGGAEKMLSQVREYRDRLFDYIESAA